MTPTEVAKRAGHIKFFYANHLRHRSNVSGTGLFHLIFNIITILLAMILLDYFTRLVVYISSGQSLQRTIANAHMLFNILGVIIILPLVPLLEQLINRLTSSREATAPAPANE